MTMTTCSSCAKEISREAAACPNCGQPNPGLKKGMRGVIALVLLGAGAWWVFGGGAMSVGSNAVIKQSLDQYEIAKRGGDPIQACVHAGFVQASYLQAKDEPNYQKWSQVQKDDCRAAGMPQ